jgi:hypothetical protein
MLFILRPYPEYFMESGRSNRLGEKLRNAVAWTRFHDKMRVEYINHLISQDCAGKGLRELQG